MTTDNGSTDDFKRAMVVTAHPDDAEYGCSATVAKWCRLGWDVVYVLCTDGSKGSEDREISSEELARIRAEEQVEAGKTLGLKDVVFLGYPDGYLEPTLELRRDISREIRRWKPDVLITTNPTRDLMSSEYLGHPDHFAAGEAALSAVFPAARDHLTFPELYTEEGLEPHKVREVWIMSFGTTANFWNPLEEQDVDTSITALKQHVTQVKNPEDAEKWMKQRRAETGKKISANYAEGFRKFTLS
ncbi:MAG: PIG-L family deacetylase [Chloroflexi bacterium]|nr:PIG-L family deacetylase [Chloroflexota bacterium]